MTFNGEEEEERRRTCHRELGRPILAVSILRASSPGRSNRFHSATTVSTDDNVDNERLPAHGTDPSTVKSDGSAAPFLSDRKMLLVVSLSTVEEIWPRGRSPVLSSVWAISSLLELRISLCVK